jgi:hypothetical protein
MGRGTTAREAEPVTAIVVSMIVILAVAGTIAGIVVVGMEGRGRFKAPRLAERMERAAQHLNGDAQELRH